MQRASLQIITNSRIHRPVMHPLIYSGRPLPPFRFNPLCIGVFFQWKSNFSRHSTGISVFSIILQKTPASNFLLPKNATFSKGNIFVRICLTQRIQTYTYVKTITIHTYQWAENIFPITRDLNRFSVLDLLAIFCLSFFLEHMMTIYLNYNAVSQI